MRLRKAHMWAVGRVALAVVLLAIVFKYLIPMRDTVYLKDGTVLTGTFAELGEDGVVIRTDGEERAVPLSQIAADRKGKPRTARGFIPLFRQMTTGRYLVGLVMLGWIPWLASMRWQGLMRAQGISLSFWCALKLTYLGLFWNNFLPGLTGGDLAKAYYAAKLTSTKKTSAVVTVFLDRLIGIVMLAGVAGAAVCVTIAFPFGPRSSAYTKASWLVAFFVACSAAGALGFFSRRLRSAARRAVKALPGHDRLRAMKLIDRLVGIIKRIDAALFLYRDKKMALARAALISVVAHSSAVTGIYFFGRALNVKEAALISCFVVVPVAFIVSSIPLAPAGWGIGEVAFRAFFGAVGVAASAAVAISVVYRLSQAVWTLPGGVVLMFQRDRPTTEQVAGEMGPDMAGGTDAAEGS